MVEMRMATANYDGADKGEWSVHELSFLVRKRRFVACRVTRNENVETKVRSARGRKTQCKYLDRR